MTGARWSRAARVLGAAALALLVFATAVTTASMALWQKAAASVVVAFPFAWFGLPALLDATRPRAIRIAPSDAAVHDDGDELPERIAARLDAPMTFLGIIFLLLVVAETVVDIDSFENAFQVASWVIWAAFAAEFAIRLWAADDVGRYLKRHWWQALLLLVPFMRFLRLVRLVRLGRAGRVVSSAVRSMRSAATTMTSRLGWLVALHVIVVLAASLLVFEFGAVSSYADALAATALSAVAGEPTGGTTAFARVMDVVLAMYAAVMFAALAAILAAFFLDRRREESTVAAVGKRRSV